MGFAVSIGLLHLLRHHDPSIGDFVADIKTNRHEMINFFRQ
jgi:hypothetical protein